MEFRAKREQQPHELTREFYQAHLDAGVQTFFGIEIGPNGLVKDRQQPELFEEWKRNGRPGRDVIQ